MTTLFSNPNSSYLGRPNAISLDRFTELLKTKNSPALPEVADIYAALQQANVDVSYALAQFRVESQYGTAGYATVTRSWGNMEYDHTLTTHANGTYTPPDNPGFTYAKYDDWLSSVKDYVVYLHDYYENRKLLTIFDATAEWIGKQPNDPYHLDYVNWIIGDIARYEWKTIAFTETGDEMIDASHSFVDGKIVTQYPLKNGTVLYSGTSGKIFTTYSGPDTTVYLLGLVNNSTSWGQIKVTSSGAPKFVYIKNIDLTRITTVA